MADTQSIIELTDANFAEQVEEQDGLMLVDFWAPWCGPCRLVSPMVEELADEYAGRVRVGKLNVDENPMIASRFGIRSIPTLALFRGGEPVDGVIGAAPKAMLRDRIEQQLAA